MKYNFQDLTVDQYQQFLVEAETLTSARVAEILTGKRKTQLTLKEVEAIELGELSPPDAVQWNKMIFIDGRAYGRADINSLSFGEFVDLLDYAKDVHKNLVEIVALLYRPIISFSYKDRVKIGISNYLSKKGLAKATMVRLMDSVQYNLEEYDPIKCDLRHRIIKKFPAHTAHWAMTFFFNFSQQLRVNSLKSLATEVKVQTKNKTKPQPTNKG